MATATERDSKPRWWVPGDWNAFFGLFTNVAAQRDRPDAAWCSCVIKLPDDIVFGRILPALGIALPLGNLYYAYLAWQLAQEGGPHRRRGDAVRPERAAHVHRRLRDHAAGRPQDHGDGWLLAWQAGLAWASSSASSSCSAPSSARRSARTRRARRCSARWPASRSRSSRCGRRSRCGKCRGSRFVTLRASC